MGWARLELNQAPIVYKTIALTAELRAQMSTIILKLNASY